MGQRRKDNLHPLQGGKKVQLTPIEQLTREKAEDCTELIYLLNEGCGIVGDETFRTFCGVSLNGTTLLRDYLRCKKNEGVNFNFASYILAIVKSAMEYRGDL